MARTAHARPAAQPAPSNPPTGLDGLLARARQLGGFDHLGLLRADGATAPLPVNEADDAWHLLARDQDAPLWQGLAVQHARFPWLSARLRQGETGCWALSRLPTEAHPAFWRSAGLCSLALAPIPDHPGHGLFAGLCQGTWRGAHARALQLTALAAGEALRAEIWRGRVLEAGAELECLRGQLQALDPCDALTGVYSRAHLDALLGQECGRAQREAQPLSLILVDIDGFADYNRRHGRDRGDYCLQQVAAALAQAFERAGETVARFQGDCFAVLLPLMARERAEAAARRLLAALRARRLPHGGDKPYLSASLGLATLCPHPGLSPELLMDCASRALHAAQAKGGDRLCEWAEPGEPL